MEKPNYKLSENELLKMWYEEYIFVGVNILYLPEFGDLEEEDLEAMKKAPGFRFFVIGRRVTETGIAFKNLIKQVFK